MRILGIDIGKVSIKVVEMDSAFGRYDVHDHHEQFIPAGTPPEQVASQLLQSLAKVPDRVIMALPSSNATFRNLQLPTRDKKAIQSGVGFELEDELPFPLEESIYDYSILAQSKQSSWVHVAATLKKYLSQAIHTWHGAGIDPDVVTTEAWAYRILFNRIIDLDKQETPILFIQLGHERTILYVHWKGAPALIREIQWGGQDITSAICQEHHLSFEQAEAVKIDHGFVSSPDPGMALTEESTRFSKCIEESLGPLALELKQIAFMTKNVTRHSLGLIYVSGGTSLLRGLPQWLEKNIQTSVKPLLAMSSTTTAGVTYSEQTEAKFLLATSLTLALVGPDRASCINFRKGEFVRQVKTRELNLKAMRKPLIAAAVLGSCLFISLFVQSKVYRSQLASIDTMLEKSVRGFFGQISNSALKTYMSDTQKLKSSVTKELNKQRELSKLFGPNLNSPLDFLNSVSISIPREITLDLLQFQAGSPSADSYSTHDLSTASLTFLVANPQSTEKLATILGGRLGNMQRGKMEETTSEGGLKKWKITFSGKPIEDSYGK